MPKLCDSCVELLTVEHTPNCKKQGLVSVHHDYVYAKFGDMCEAALTKARVSNEPKIELVRPAPMQWLKQAPARLKRSQ